MKIRYIIRQYSNYKTIRTMIVINGFYYIFPDFPGLLGNKKLSRDIKKQFMKQPEIEVLDQYNTGDWEPGITGFFHVGDAWLIEKLKKKGKFHELNQSLIDKLRK